MSTLSHGPFNFKSILIVLFEEAAKSLVLTRRSGTPRQEWINTKGDEGSQTRCKSVKQARGYGFTPDFLIFIQSRTTFINQSYTFNIFTLHQM